jgi:hypothetical protein
MAVHKEDTDILHHDQLLGIRVENAILYDEGGGEPIAVSRHRPEGASPREDGQLYAGQVSEPVSREKNPVGTDAADGFFYEIGTAVAVRNNKQGHGCLLSVRRISLHHIVYHGIPGLSMNFT